MTTVLVENDVLPADAAPPVNGSAGSSDEDDMPLSSLVKKANPPSAEGKISVPHIKPDPGASGATENGNGAIPAAATSTATAPIKPEEDDDGDDDDLPIAALVAKKQASAGAASQGNGEVARKKEKKVKPETDGEEAAKKRKRQEGEASTGRTSKKKTGGKHTHLTQEFYGTTKGELVQKLLCRWWYAIQWPETDDVGPPPPEYESLEGYPGVFVSVRGEQVGHVLDRRNPNTCPNFTNLSKKPTDELKALLTKALEEQKKQLKEHEGANKKVERQIDKELSWVKKVNPKSADREAKQAGFPGEG